MTRKEKRRRLAKQLGISPAGLSLRELQAMVAKGRGFQPAKLGHDHMPLHAWLDVMPYARRNRGKARVPGRVRKTSRRAASSVSGLGPKGVGRDRTRWPIGDLYHAKLAIQYINAGFGDKKDYSTIVRNIKKRYPEYNWDALLTRKVR